MMQAGEHFLLGSLCPGAKLCLILCVKPESYHWACYEFNNYNNHGSNSMLFNHCLTNPRDEVCPVYWLVSMMYMCMSMQRIYILWKLAAHFDDCVSNQIGRSHINIHLPY